MQLNTVRILVVDDEPFARAALAELLRDESYTVATAEDGLSALRMLAEFAPDVVLTDLKMPRLDGIGLLRKVLERDPACRVIVMSANNFLGTEDIAGVVRRAGAAGFLVKPLDFDELLLTIKRARASRHLEEPVGPRRATHTALRRLRPSHLRRRTGHRGRSDSRRAAVAPR